MFLDKGNILSDFNHLFNTEASCHISLYSHPGMEKQDLFRSFLKAEKRYILKLPLYLSKKTSVC